MRNVHVYVYVYQWHHDVQDIVIKTVAIAKEAVIDDDNVAAVGDGDGASGSGGNADTNTSVNSVAGLKALVSARADEFCTGLARAINAHELARVQGLPADEHRKVHAAILDNFTELNNSDTAALRIYFKTKRYKVMNDIKSALSIKRCREAISGASGVKAATPATDEPKQKAPRVTAGRKIPIDEVRDTLDRVVDRFSTVIAGLCDEIRRLRGEVKEARGEEVAEAGVSVECVADGGQNGDAVNGDAVSDSEATIDE